MEIKTSTSNAKWYTAWKKRIESGRPREGDYNFVIFESKGETIYQPPADGSAPSVFRDGEWKEIVAG